MNLNFLKEYGAVRAGRDAGMTLPALFGDNRPDQADVTSDDANSNELDYENRQWEPIDVSRAEAFDEERRPRRFVDGKDVGWTVAWLTSPDEGLPVPVRLAQVGAVALRGDALDPGCSLPPQRLGCEVRTVERVVSFAADLFPWRDVEGFVAALQARGFRVLFVRDERVRRRQSHGGITQPDFDAAPAGDYDFAILRNTAKTRTINRMFEMERQAFRHNLGMPTVIDGSLQTKVTESTLIYPVTGVVKTHSNIPQDGDLNRTLMALGPMQRTPVYGRCVKDLKFLTWFLRLGEGAGESPAESAVRIEIGRPFFEQVLNAGCAAPARCFAYIDALSNWLCRCQTRDGGYGRAATTIYPIQRAEDLLRSIYVEPDTLASRFYHLTGL